MQRILYEIVSETVDELGMSYVLQFSLSFACTTLNQISPGRLSSSSVRAFEG
jgi:hypothetical protein